MWLWQTASWLTLAGELALCVPVVYLAAVSVSAIVCAQELKRDRRVKRRAETLNVLGDDSESTQVGVTGSIRFAIIIPAHNEEGVIGQLLASICALEYPRDLFDVYVIADNCDDDTAGVAERSGVARALSRHDEARRGKGYALAWAFERLLSHAPEYGAFVVIDADSIVNAHLLTAYAHALRSGAPAAQASNMVLNTGDSPATVLRWLALTLMNYVRPLGRNGLGGSSTLTGNGMCLSRRLLVRLPWTAFGLSEDYQYYLTIVEAGEWVRFAPEARVRSVMPTTFDAMRSQDLRWESAGHGPSTREWFTRLVRQALRHRDWRRFDAALELVAPPLSQVIVAVALADTLGVCFMLALGLWAPLVLAALLTLGLGVYLGSALFMTRPPARAYLALLSAPGFLLWKVWLAVALRGRTSRTGAWIRTERAHAPAPR